MPVYPGLALLLGCTMASESKWVHIGNRTIGVIAAVATVAILAIFFQVHGLPTPGDISTALQQHPGAYTLSLGHMGDLTLASFAYLRAPLLLAGLAFLIGAVGAWIRPNARVVFAFAVMMVLFFHASRRALVVFDPYLSSRPLAEALLRVPEGRLILNSEYYAFSSVFFYTNRSALLLNGRGNNLEYGSYAPGSANVFINDAQFVKLWSSGERFYVLTESPSLQHLTGLVGAGQLLPVAQSGGKLLLTNRLSAMM